MFSSELFSHPDILLVDHIRNVADMCEQAFLSHETKLPEFFDKKSWQQLIWIMGFCHDFGKATQFFQDYLKEKNQEIKQRMKAKKETNHALISAVLAHIILCKVVKNSENTSELWQSMPFFIFLAIKRHHGNINNAVRMSNTDDANELDIEYAHIDKQFDSIDENEFNYLLALLNKQCCINMDRNDFPDSLSDYYKKTILWNEKKRIKQLVGQLDYYFIFQYLFSLLIQSDKEEAIFNRQFEFQRKTIQKDVVKQYIQDNFASPKSQINIIRDSIFNDARDSIERVDLDNNRIFSLNVPTGTGKTFTALSIALQLRARFESAKKITPRIIYSLPFTSIIDQNYDVFKDVLKNPDPDTLIKHHHLSDIFFKSGVHEFETDESKFLIESWKSEIVVTTMFQLFHSMITNRNRMLIKFSKLANAIVLCDEIQSLPYKYWKLVREIMCCISSLFNTCFILITATQPRIFDKNEIIELVPDKLYYFSKLDRVNVTFEKTPLTLSEYKKKCITAIHSSDESFLFVMNTVNSALELFETLSETDCNAEFFFLATNIVPLDRLLRIQTIRRVNTRKIIIATQMIEAGVDIDIDIVWRDMGPLESINQVCGRCNRNFTKKKGEVRIFQILNENHRNTPFEKYIYGKNPLSIYQTRAIIANNDTVSETSFLNNMDKYYNEIQQRLRPEDSDKILKSMKNLQFLSASQQFKLIDEENYERKDIFIELDEKAENIWRNYLELREIADNLKRKIKFLKIKKDFYNYVISVPSQFVVDAHYDDSNFVYISKDMLSVCYDKKTGWIRKKQEIYTF